MAPKLLNHFTMENKFSELTLCSFFLFSSASLGLEADRGRFLSSSLILSRTVLVLPVFLKPDRHEGISISPSRRVLALMEIFGITVVETCAHAKTETNVKLCQKTLQTDSRHELASTSEHDTLLKMTFCLIVYFI